jgi:hypothetical protein
VDKETDISQISKYLKGALDAKAMHQLEKRALDDPFLMDALEGYEANGKDQQIQLDEIAERLKKRVSGNEKRIVPWRYFAIAASVLILATVGSILVFNQKAAKPQMAQNVTPVATTKPAPAAVQEPRVNDELAKTARAVPTTKRKQADYQHIKTGYDAKVAAPVASPAMAEDAVAEEKIGKPEGTVASDTTPLNEMIVTEYTSGKKKDISQNLVSNNLLRVKKADTIVTQTLQGQVKGVAYNNVTAPRQQFGAAPLPGAGNTMKEVSIAHKGDEPSASLAAGNGVAAKARKSAENNRDSLKTSSADFKNNSLAEVAIAAPAPQAKQSNGLEAHPKKGWESFKKYLDQNAISPDNNAGLVTVSFLVDQNGVISNLQVAHGLSDATNQKAINLISNGPAWLGNANGQPQKVEVKIKFNK